MVNIRLTQTSAVGGKIQHLVKYKNVYDEWYPSATKIMITSTTDFLWNSTATNVCFVHLHFGITHLSLLSKRDWFR